MSQVKEVATGGSLRGGGGMSMCVVASKRSAARLGGVEVVKVRLRRLFHEWCLRTMACSQRWKQSDVATGRCARLSSCGTRLRSKFSAARKRGTIPFGCERESTPRTKG
eukprot:5518003-Amphidinium_carterae.2